MLIVQNRILSDRMHAARALAFERAVPVLSGYAVAVAMLSKRGQIYAGCNFEYPLFNDRGHAEQVAIGRGITAEGRAFDIDTILLGASRHGSALPVERWSKGASGPLYCGNCRQWLIEAMSGDTYFELDADGVRRERHKNRDLLPHPFDPSILGGGVLSANAEDILPLEIAAQKGKIAEQLLPYLQHAKPVNAYFRVELQTMSQIVAGIESEMGNLYPGVMALGVHYHQLWPVISAFASFTMAEPKGRVKRLHWMLAGSRQGIWKPTESELLEANRSWLGYMMEGGLRRSSFAQVDYRILQDTVSMRSYKAM